MAAERRAAVAAPVVDCRILLYRMVVRRMLQAGAATMGNPGLIRRLLLIGLILAASPAFGQDGLPADFYGDWQGEELESSQAVDDGEVTAADLSVRIEPDGDGFRMRWVLLARERSGGPLKRQPIEARFALTGRPGVFASAPEQRSMLLRLFGDSPTSNPLEGEPLLWARFDGEVLSVYRLAITSDGGVDLYQHRRSLMDGGMAARYVHRTDAEPPMILEGRLRRAGD